MRRRGLGIAVITAALATGCMGFDAAATYYPAVRAGERVAKSGWGITFNLGFSLTARRVHTYVARGFDIAAARYKDSTGSGSIGHLSPWAARMDLAAKHLGGLWWLNASGGGTWGQGAAAVKYDEGTVMSGADNPKVRTSTWSAFLGPSFQIDGGQAFDAFFTIAPTVYRSTNDAFDPFTAYGMTFRVHFTNGPRPGPFPVDFGIGKLFRSGYQPQNPVEPGWDKDLNRSKDQERERQRNEKRDRCRSEGRC